MKLKHTKTLTTYSVVVDGKPTSFSTKSMAIKLGKMAKRINKDVKLIEEYRLWDIQPGIPAKLVDHQVFDRTILITDE